MSIRVEKISNLVKEEISLIFLHKMQDPAFGLVTITGVKLTSDLKQAKVYISVYDRENRDLILEKVEKVKGFIRSQLGSRIRLRYVPELSFYIDDTLDYVEHMEGIFKKIHENDQKKSD